MATAYTSAPAGPFSAFGRLAGPTHALLRIGAGLLFMQHGAQKLFGALGGMDGKGMKAELMTQMGAAGILEFFGGLLIVIGLATRPVAALLFIQMLVAYFQAHMPQGGLPVQNGGELALLYALAWAFFAGNGAGPLSVDDALARRRGPGRNS
jgi:putative oxidoreductase